VGWGGDAIGVADELLNDLPVSWAPYVIYVACLQTHGVNEALLACKDTQSIKHTHCCSQSNTPCVAVNQTHPPSKHTQSINLSPQPYECQSRIGIQIYFAANEMESM